MSTPAEILNNLILSEIKPSLEDIYDDAENLHSEIDIVDRLHEMIMHAVQFDDVDDKRKCQAYSDVQTLAIVISDKMLTIRKISESIVERLSKAQ